MLPLPTHLFSYWSIPLITKKGQIMSKSFSFLCTLFNIASSAAPQIYCVAAQDAGIKPRAGIFKQYMGARNRGRIGLSYQSARLRRLAEFIPWN
jgi:hypothetical protein